MARVPNTEILSLVNDIIPVIDDDPATGSITNIADNGSGFARLTTSSTTGLRVGRDVIITGTAGYNGTWEVTALTSTTIDIEEIFDSGESTGIWTADITSLAMCFLSADASLFDPQYNLSGNRMSEFRNYGPTGALTLEDTEDSGGYYGTICGNADFFFVSCGTSGLRSYTVDADGTLHLKDTDLLAGATYLDIACNEDYVFVLISISHSATYVHLSVLQYTWDAFGVLTQDDVAGLVRHRIDREIPSICIAGNYILFTASGLPDIGSDEYQMLNTVSYGPSPMTGADQYLVGDISLYQYFDCSWDASNDKVVITGADGIHMYTINQITGIVSYFGGNLIDVIDGLHIYSDGTYNYIGSLTEGLSLFKQVTEHDNNDPGTFCFGTVYSSEYNLIYTCRINYIRRLRIAPSDTMNFIAEQNFNASHQCYIWPDETEIMLVTHGNSGLKSYSIEL